MASNSFANANVIVVLFGMQPAGVPLQQQSAAYLGQANPFAPAFAQQASQLAAALAQAQAAQASQLLPAHFAPQQLQQPSFPQFPGAQVHPSAVGNLTTACLSAPQRQLCVITDEAMVGDLVPDDFWCN
jgi:hypothetical protein